MTTRESTEALVRQNIKALEQGMVRSARERLKHVLDDGQRGEGGGPDHAVYAACRAFIEVYEKIEAKGDQNG